MAQKLELITSTPMTTMITIDSADRNQLMYPSPSSYTYKLPNSIRNADTIELMMFQMIRTEADIHSGNCNFQVTLNNGNPITVILPLGEINSVISSYTTHTSGTVIYSSSSSNGLGTGEINVSGSNNLAALLQYGLNNTPGLSGFTVTASPNTDILTITNANQFTLIINELQSRLFGFQGTLITGFERGAGNCVAVLNGGSYSLVGTRAADLNGEPYLLLNINDYRQYVSVNSYMQKAFLIIPLESVQVGRRFLISNDLKEKKGTYKLDKSQNKIDNLNISITRPDGSLYDFKGTDHQIVLRINKKDNHNFLN